ncbi:hypothetical protein RDI58_029650 [Solanum bulbocastanum]|uniref:Aldehyde dehydrogenase domain-containing protein n=1 Tax=Solanum bulbocastanum TaxID=147425 RepID=A0AAN8SYN1_SOLBU
MKKLTKKILEICSARKTFETIDPRNEEVIASIAEGDKDDVDLAVKAASFRQWPLASLITQGNFIG